MISQVHNDDESGFPIDIIIEAGKPPGGGASRTNVVGAEEDEDKVVEDELLMMVEVEKDIDGVDETWELDCSAV